MAFRTEIVHCPYNSVGTTMPHYDFVSTCIINMMKMDQKMQIHAINATADELGSQLQHQHVNDLIAFDMNKIIIVAVMEVTNDKCIMQHEQKFK